MDTIQSIRDGERYRIKKLIDDKIEAYKNQLDLLNQYGCNSTHTMEIHTKWAIIEELNNLLTKLGE